MQDPDLPCRGRSTADRRVNAAEKCESPLRSPTHLGVGFWWWMSPLPRRDGMLVIGRDKPAEPDRGEPDARQKDNAVRLACWERRICLHGKNSDDFALTVPDGSCPDAQSRIGAQ